MTKENFIKLIEEKKYWTIYEESFIDFPTENMLINNEWKIVPRQIIVIPELNTQEGITEAHLLIRDNFLKIRQQLEIAIWLYIHKFKIT